MVRSRLRSHRAVLLKEDPHGSMRREVRSRCFEQTPSLVSEAAPVATTPHHQRCPADAGGRYLTSDSTARRTAKYIGRSIRPVEHRSWNESRMVKIRNTVVGRRLARMVVALRRCCRCLTTRVRSSLPGRGRNGRWASSVEADPHSPASSSRRDATRGIRCGTREHQECPAAGQSRLNWVEIVPGPYRPAVDVRAIGSRR